MPTLECGDTGGLCEAPWESYYGFESQLCAQLMALKMHLQYLDIATQAQTLAKITLTAFILQGFCENYKAGSNYLAQCPIDDRIKEIIATTIIIITATRVSKGIYLY